MEHKSADVNDARASKTRRKDLCDGHRSEFVALISCRLLKQCKASAGNLNREFFDDAGKVRLFRNCARSGDAFDFLDGFMVGNGTGCGGRGAWVSTGY